MDDLKKHCHSPLGFKGFGTKRMTVERSEEQAAGDQWPTCGTERVEVACIADEVATGYSWEFESHLRVFVC